MDFKLNSMKKIIFILLFFFVNNLGYSQYNIVEEKKYDTSLKVNYSNIMYKNIKVINPIIYLYVVIDNSNEEDLKKQLRLAMIKNKIKNSIFYFVKYPPTILNKTQKENFFLNFMCSILAEKKMIDSDFILITDSDVTTLYENVRLRKLEYNRKGIIDNNDNCKSYLNEINTVFISKKKNHIIKFIKQQI